MQPPTCPLTQLPSPTAQQIEVSRSDRWTLYHRLQMHEIACWCPENGSLWVEVQTATTAVLIHSVVRQCLAPRRELVQWLNRCWHAG